MVSLLESSLNRQSVFHDLITARVSGGKSEPTSTIQLTARACLEPETSRAPTTAKDAAPPVTFLTPGLALPKSMSSGQSLSRRPIWTSAKHTDNEHSQGAELDIFILSSHICGYDFMKHCVWCSKSPELGHLGLGVVIVWWSKLM